MDISELEKRIAALEDIEAIKKLKARYCSRPTGSGRAPASDGIRGTRLSASCSRDSRNGSASRSTT
jgi:hypothetical protein